MLRARGEPVAADATLRPGPAGRLDLGGTGRLAVAGGAVVRLETGWTAEAPRLEIEVKGGGGRARLNGGALDARPARGAPWRAELGRSDAGRSSAEFLAALEEGRPARLATAREAARVGAVLDAMTGRGRLSASA